LWDAAAAAGEKRVVDIIENQATLSSRISVEEGATRGSRLTFLTGDDRRNNET